MSDFRGLRNEVALRHLEEKAVQLRVGEIHQEFEKDLSEIEREFVSFIGKGFPSLLGLEWGFSNPVERAVEI